MLYFQTTVGFILLTLNALLNIMPSMHLYIVHKKFEGYRNSLDKKRQKVFDWLVFEVAGMREETLVMHHDHPEAKSEGDVGRLQRRHMVMNTADVNHIGKESDEIEEAIALGDDPGNVMEYAESDKNKVKIIATAPRKAASEPCTPVHLLLRTEKDLKGEDYKPQKQTKKRIKGL